MKDPREYYDRFSEGYDRRRDKGYHALLDELESDTVRRHITPGLVLDAGCGTGLVSARLKPFYPRIIGADLSIGMVHLAADRGQPVLQAELGALPFKDEVFDGVFSFKVLAHIPNLKKSLEELERVLKPSGTLVLEFYNLKSIRGIKKRFRIRHRVAENTDETEVYTAFHSHEQIRKIIPENLSIKAIRGIMIFTPLAIFHRLPLLGPLLGWMERKFCDGFLKQFGGFMVIIMTK